MLGVKSQIHVPKFCVYPWTSPIGIMRIDVGIANSPIFYGVFVAGMYSKMHRWCTDTAAGMQRQR